MWTAVSFSDSHRGAETQDRWGIVERPGGGLLLAVADGVGGREYGGEAAENAIRLVREGHANVRVGDSRGWAELITWIDSELAALEKVGQTTLVVVEVTPKRIVGASAGDSEAWKTVPNTARFPIYTALTREQQKKPFLGAGMARAVGFRDRALRPGETLLIASDGLFRYTDTDRILEAVQTADLNAAARALGQAARGSDSNQLYDDLALIVCRTLPA